MQIVVHRSAAQIGGNVIEVRSRNTRVILDAGRELPPLDGSRRADRMEVEGLTFGKRAFDAVFLSHHHGDHCGLLDRLLPDIPVYAGRRTSHVLDVIADFTGGAKRRTRPLEADTVRVGDLTVTPISVEHSSHEAFMFLIQDEGRDERKRGKSVLYTGDYRNVDGAVERLRERVGAEGLDLLITEGTNVAVESPLFRDEDAVAAAAEKLMAECGGTVFVLCSSTNEPRVRALHAACARAGRTPCHDLFMSAVRSLLAPADPQPPMRFVAGRVAPERPEKFSHFKAFYDRRQLVGVERLAKRPERLTVFVRTSMFPRFEGGSSFMTRFLRERGGEGHALIYSLWGGYKRTEPMRSVLDFCAERGIPITDIHSSGHASNEAIRNFVAEAAPRALIPIHCAPEDRERFRALHENCILLRDGEAWAVE